VNERAEEVRVQELLADIADFATSAARIVARGRDAFMNPHDDTQRRAGKSILIDLSAAAERLPEAFRAAHPEVPWPQIRGIRNVAAHNYRDVNLDVIWEVLRSEFPRLVAQLDL
jgi:uncharacterized protein with HEPN domain